MTKDLHKTKKYFKVKKLVVFTAASNFIFCNLHEKQKHVNYLPRVNKMPLFEFGSLTNLFSNSKAVELEKNSTILNYNNLFSQVLNRVFVTFQLRKSKGRISDPEVVCNFVTSDDISDELVIKLTEGLQKTLNDSVKVTILKKLAALQISLFVNNEEELSEIIKEFVRALVPNTESLDMTFFNKKYARKEQHEWSSTQEVIMDAVGHYMRDLNLSTLQNMYKQNSVVKIEFAGNLDPVIYDFVLGKFNQPIDHPNGYVELHRSFLDIEDKNEIMTIYFKEKKAQLKGS
jgi:hypothetical protein